MIKEISIKNFKSIKEADVHFSENTNLIVGLNGAGKTNLVKAILLIKNIVSGKASGATIEEAIKDMVLVPQELFFEQNTSKNISLKIVIGDESGSFSYEVVIGIQNATPPIISIKEEKLSEFIEGKEKNIIVREGNVVKDGENNTIPIQVASNQSFSIYQTPKIITFRDLVKNISIIDAYTANLSKQNTLVRYDDPTTLTSSIIRLKNEDPEKFKIFEKSLKQLLPSLSSITDFSSGGSQVENDKVYLLLFEQAKLAGKLSFKGLSDGDVRTIMIILNTVILGTDSTLIIEEIENALHPHRFKSLIEHLKKHSYANNLQIIFSTHNPVIIDSVSAKEIIYVQRKNGDGSKFIHLGESKYSSKIQAVLDEGGNLTEILESII